MPANEPLSLGCTVLDAEKGMRANYDLLMSDTVQTLLQMSCFPR